MESYTAAKPSTVGVLRRESFWDGDFDHQLSLEPLSFLFPMCAAAGDRQRSPAMNLCTFPSLMLLLWRKANSEMSKVNVKPRN